MNHRGQQFSELLLPLPVGKAGSCLQGVMKGSQMAICSPVMPEIPPQVMNVLHI